MITVRPWHAFAISPRTDTQTDTQTDRQKRLGKTISFRFVQIRLIWPIICESRKSFLELLLATVLLNKFLAKINSIRHTLSQYSALAAIKGPCPDYRGRAQTIWPAQTYMLFPWANQSPRDKRGCCRTAPSSFRVPTFLYFSNFNSDAEFKQILEFDD